MNRKATFKQSDVARALKAAKDAGYEPQGYRVLPDGTIEVRISDAPFNAAGPNPCDELLK